MKIAGAPQGASNAVQCVDVVVIGAGFGGLYALYKLRSMGLQVCVLELAPDVGGVWHSNRYPGARADVESLQYSYSFDEKLQQDWAWSERFATQPEILAYAQHVATRFDLRRSIFFNTRATTLVFDEAKSRWDIQTDSIYRFDAKYVVSAVGCLSAKQRVNWTGLASFNGKVLYTAAWPVDRVSFSGNDVVVVGTGPSGVQVIPEIASEARTLTILQRTAAFCVPARNSKLDPERVAQVKAKYSELRRKAREETHAGIVHEKATLQTFEVDAESRWMEYERRWTMGGPGFLQSFVDIMSDGNANREAADFVRSRIRGIVIDKNMAELLCPETYPIGGKTLCVGTNYYETFNSENVALVDVKSDPVDHVDEDAVVLTSGRRIVADAIVFATGFDAMTGPLLSMKIVGRKGRVLSDVWADAPRAYLGLATAEFPNFLMIAGPGSPGFFGNAIVSIEHHVEWIADCLDFMRQHKFDCIEADRKAQEEWFAEVQSAAAKLLLMKADSWYLGANIPGKPRHMLAYCGAIPMYQKKCAAVAAGAYTGFHLSRTSLV